MNYEEALSKIPFYVIHPRLKPFIGEKYEEYKILIVGESIVDKKSFVLRFTDDSYIAHYITTVGR